MDNRPQRITDLLELEDLPHRRAIDVVHGDNLLFGGGHRVICSQLG